MANPIKKDELVTDEALGQLKLMADRLTVIADNLTKAKEACQSWGEEEKKNSATTSNNVEELSKMAARITQLEDTIKKLNAAEKENENARRSVNEQKRLYRKLTDDEIKSVEDLKRALQGSVDEQMKAVNAINAEKMSYNQLQQTYNAVRDALNKMTPEQLKSTEAGKLLAAQGLKIRDAMNEMQKATGNYTLQVGKYRAAFDGLGYSFMQIMREAPSALNFDQFLLAISNNIPIFMDQAKSYVDGLKKDLTELQKKADAGLQLTQEEMERMGEAAKITKDGFSQVIGVVKRLKTAIFSTGGLTLLITMLLRYMPKITKWVKDTAKDIEKLFKLTNKFTRELQVANGQIDKAIANASSAEIAKLNIIVDRLDTVKRGTQEWIDMIAMVNETTGRHISDLEAMPENIRKIVQEWTDMQRKLAENAELTKILGQNDAGMMKKRMVLDKAYGTPEDRAALVGGENQERIAELIRYVEKYNLNDVDNMSIWQFIMANVGRRHGSFAKVAELENLVDKELGIISQKTKDALERRLNIISDPSKNNGGGSGSGSFEDTYKAPTMGEVLIAEANAMKEKGTTVLEEIRLWYEKRVAIAEAAYEKEKEDIQRDKGDKENSLTKNLENARIFIEKYNRTVSDLDKEHTAGNLTDKEWKAQKDKLARQYKDAQDLISRENTERARIQRWVNARYTAAQTEHENQLTDLVKQEQEKRAKVIVDDAKRNAKAVETEFKHSGTAEEMEQYAAQMQEVINKLVELSQAEEYGEGAMNIFADAIANMNNQLETMNETIDKNKLSEIEQKYNGLMKVVHNRVKTINDEKLKNEDLTHNIDILKQKLKELTDEQMRSGKGDVQKAKDIEKLRQAIERYQQQISHTKQLANYTDLGDIFKRNVNVGSGTQRNIMEAILGKDAYKAFEGDDEALKNAIAKDFDEWAENAMSAVTTWYSTTMGYINDLISAYVELANAKAEAAKEATEAAQEEYDKEKALLEAGYASRVEATWAEYQEKKAAQEKAEADAKAAAQAQQQLNEVETMGSLIVASANIWKTFSKIPTVGIPLAIAALTTMWGSFAAAKIKAAEVSKYGEGGFEVLEGGSHASGHDIDLGVRNRRGRRMRAEGREGLGIFSRRAMDHYGANNIEAMVNSVNRLEFEGNAAKRMSLERNIGLQMLSMPRTDLHKVESGIDKIVALGSRNIHHNPDGTVVETRKNARIVYKNI